MFSLLATRRFAPLFWTQLFSAFNDNFLKNALVFLILYRIGGSNAETLVTAAGGVFIAPFFFLSGLGGQLADRFDKAFMARRLKLIEIGAAGVAVIGFLMQSVPVLFGALFLFGVIAALFGPIKYGILPDHLETKELPAGNALVEGATFLAIIAGTMAGGYASSSGATPALFGILVMAFAALCWLSSLAIPKTGEAAPDLRIESNIFRSTSELIRELWGDARLWRTGIMVSIFWLIGAVVMSLMPALVKNGLGGSEQVASVYLTVFAVSIALGSAIGSHLASGRIVLMPVPVASALMGLCALDLAWAVSGLAHSGAPQGVAAFFAKGVSWRVGADLAGLAIAGGVFIVPSFAAAQAWAPEDRRARVIAGINVLNAGFMVAGALVFGALQGAGWSFSALFGLIGAICLVSTIWIWAILPTDASAAG